MRTRTLGRTGVRVTELAYGAAGIGNLFRPVPDEEAAAAIDAAWDAGIRTFDTAPHYGLGLSERRLGAALRGRPREAYTISTKVGRLLVENSAPEGDDLANGFAVPATHRRVFDFTADGVRRSLEASLARLGLDRVDVVLLHDPDDHVEQALREAYPALERLRDEGVVGAIGVGMNQCAAPARFLRETDIDVVLLAGRYTLLEQEGLAELLPEATARGRSVLIGGAFNSGLLIDPKPGATYDYAPAPTPVLDRALRLRAVTERHGVPLRAAALAFPSAHPAVAAVLTGARSVEEVRDTVDLHGRPVPAALWDELRAEGLLGPNVPVPQPEESS
ncbi:MULTISPECIES: aldo/keto reductase [Streptomyces]|uniref:Aldo/keto reductase n=1 Tax=Streptomyces caniscabiei TaxID=2746961 RepID=A0ABU4N429_9ACTN|nr:MULTISPECIES: aldo/keto reductase [Streptomyces]MBE4741395.1 aldo/keto reductase [Streptomyces caniscabiei]MBE4761452.1 aldo/keto reductase [Streptomyces caniscabiei]MBE4769555.1 aldo/keto reductase [Streptomyces caniscabiei]MBE4789879.1 aldo/keto reductase [Streptomyces caniscabiei]MBE4799101.1 aldo/keto reductase [Streptomyces caniscabiei]